MGNQWKTQVTPPEVDIAMMVFAGLGILPFGVAMMLDSDHFAVGGTFAFIGVVNLINSWKLWRKVRSPIQE